MVTKTYLDLKRDSEAFSRALEGMGMLGKHVAVIGPTTYEWIISYFGAADSGCVIVPLDAQVPAADVCELLNRADISVLVYDELRRDVAELAGEKCPEIKCMVSMQAKEDTGPGQTVCHLIYLRHNRQKQGGNAHTPQSG